jgi:hypothetical protein
MVETIEPDRLIAFSNFFTIAAPTLIIWNVNNVRYGNGTGKTAWILWIFSSRTNKNLISLIHQPFHNFIFQII